jgi:hypothetical protein
MPRLQITDANPNFLTLSDDTMIAAHKHTKIYKDETGSEVQLFGAIWTATMGDTMTLDKKDFLKKCYVDNEDKDTKRVGGGRRRRSSLRKNYKKSVRRVKSAKRASRSRSRKYRNRK